MGSSTRDPERIGKSTSAPKTSGADRRAEPGASQTRRRSLLRANYQRVRGCATKGEGSVSLGKLAEGALFQLNNLEIGCKSPEIEGEDIDEKPMKLSEFRGKVVVLSFWAGWCGPCMGMVPAEKALVERMKHRPFVLVGVNGDTDRAKAKSISSKEGINWRSFWDGGLVGKTAVKWSVKEWPTVYLIDAKGVIRKVSQWSGL